MKNISLFFILVLMCALPLFAQKKPSPSTQKMDCQPLITTTTLRQFLRGKELKDIPAVDSDGGATDWTFVPAELVEIDIIESKLTANTVVTVIQIKSGQAPGLVEMGSDNEPLPATIIEGRLRLSLEKVAGEWTLLKVENLSVKYRYVDAEIVKSEPTF